MDGSNPSSSGVAEGLTWLKYFFRREASESRAKVTVSSSSSNNKSKSKSESESAAEAGQEPLGQEQREMGVKR